MSDLIERPNAKHFNFTIGIDEDGILYVPFREVVDNLQSFPTIEAIPIDWIKGWLASAKPMVHISARLEIGRMVKEWEMECKEE